MNPFKMALVPMFFVQTIQAKVFLIRLLAQLVGGIMFLCIAAEYSRY